MLIAMLLQDSGDQLTDQETVSVDVTCERVGPVANDDEATIEKDTPVTIHVLENDEDPDNFDHPDALTVEEFNYDSTNNWYNCN